MDEFEIIRRYFTPDKTGEHVIVGVGDDGAVMRPKPGRDLVTAVSYTHLTLPTNREV